MRHCRIPARRVAFVPILALTAALLVGLPGPGAQASCKCGERRLSWSFPADGAEAVPTDAVLWTLATLGTDVTAARVGDVALTGLSGAPEIARRFDFAAVGGLLPETDYDVDVDVASCPDDDVVETVRIHFRTGGGPAAAEPPETVVVGHRQVDDEDYSGPDHALDLCTDVAWSQECYDTGPRAALSFHVTQPAEAPFFVVEPHDDDLGLPARVLWPGDCGPPAIFARTGGWWDDLEHCFDLRAAAPDGQLGPATTYCGTFAREGMGGVDRWEPDPGDAGADGGGDGGGADGGGADGGVGADGGGGGGGAADGAGGCAAGGGSPAGRIPGAALAPVLFFGALLLRRGARRRPPSAA